MKKKDIFLIILLFCFILSPFGAVFANNIDIFLPEEVKKIRFDMSVDEYNKDFPNAKPVVKDAKISLYYFDIKNDNLWNTMACIFDNDLLTFFSLTIIDTSESLVNKHFFNIDTEACMLISKITKNFGKLKQKYIIEKSGISIYYEPLMIWEIDTLIVQMSYTPYKTIKNVKNPGISLAFSKKGIDYLRFYKKLLYEDTDTISFDSLLTDEIKKELYNSGTNN